MADLADHSLGCIGHAEAGQVAVGQGEQRHDDDVSTVVTEEDGQPGVGDVAHHEERDEEHAGKHHHGEEPALLCRLCVVEEEEEGEEEGGCELERGQCLRPWDGL